MRVDFLQTADDEFAEAIAYYNLQSEGLGLVDKMRGFQGRNSGEPQT